MASYQMRQRDPLLDRNMQAMLERRGKELLGLALLALAGAVALMLWSYTPEDPGWMVATDAPAQNLLGRPGASVASTLVIICGLGAWGVPLVFLAWGMRFVLHRGEDRALGRIVFAVIAVAIGSVFAATHVPGPGWTHSFGLGGLFGDTILGALLGLLPVGAGLGLKLASVLSGVALLVMGLYVTGFSLTEIKGLFRFLLVGLVMTYSAALGLATRGAAGTAQAIRDRRADRLADRAARFAVAGPADAEPPLWATAPREAGPVWRGLGAEPPLTARPAPAAPDPAFHPAPPSAPRPPPRERAGLLSRMPALLSLRAREPEPELVEPGMTDWDEAGAPTEERIRARITDAVRARIRARPAIDVSTPPAPGAEPFVSRRRGPGPLIASLQRAVMPAPAPPPAAAGLGRAEPPLTLAPAARHAAAGPAAAWDQSPEDWDDDLDDGGPDIAATPVADGFEDDDYGDDLPPAMPLRRLDGVTPEARRVVQAPAARPAPPSRQAVAEAQPRLRFEDALPAYEMPPLSLLSNPSAVQRFAPSVEALEENARMLESVLDDYGVKGEITSVRPGPVVTMYELEPAPGLKASRVIGLADDIARSMSALSARVSTVPGRTVIGIELPNAQREKVVLREILSARDFGDTTMRLPLALGKDIGGAAVVANLAKMPHLLIAGTTGSGKSVAINTMILSLLYKLTPEECRLIMIDPKMLELSVYDGIPHLLSPVVTDPKKAVVALKWVVGEMEERYRKMSRMGVRNIEGYNGRVREALSKGEMFRRTIQTGFDDDTGDPVFETEEFAPVALPYIVVIVDEMADLMMVAGKEIEACIQRLAQMARASGIHLIMATQRPSVDVITGTIKANFPTRISFQVTSKIDSRTILGEQGAEQLLGMGDMLYMAGGAKITRIHGPFVSDEEVEEIVTHLKSFGPPVYMSGVVEGVEDDKAEDIDLVLGLGGEAGDEALYDQAVAVVAKDRKCSTSYIQRKLGIGYNKAARLVEQMEEQGVVTRANHVGKREILLPER
jgi:S-DNA-T family DNA segregation ATPase FtsK/SpoIIIE